MSFDSNPGLSLVRRPRRLRRSAAIRGLCEETALSAGHLVQPLFVVAGDGSAEPIESMPGQMRLPLAALADECGRLFEFGVPAVALFPCVEPGLKREDGREALNPDTLVLRAVRSVKAVLPEMAVITDIALDPYTTHGHDGLVDTETGTVLNDPTVEVLAEMAVLHADAGSDFVAPSDMMDGRVGEIRRELDGQGHIDTGILAYSAKFASAFYGPFRDAVGSSSAAGTRALDKRGYQLNPANLRESLLEAAEDEGEGADIVMVKPAGPYLDVIRGIRERTDLPVAAYQVSGEYAQIHAAAERGWLDLGACRDESLLAIRRAGADLILSYFAGDFAAAVRRTDG